MPLPPRAAALCMTPHGPVETPAFMPVGTQGTVKGLEIEQVRATGAQMVLCNTYHLALRPGPDVVDRLGGLHAFMGWDGPILTDSGGFQMFSLADRTQVTEQSAVFRSHIDGSRIELVAGRRDADPADARQRHRHGPGSRGCAAQWT